MPIKVACPNCEAVLNLKDDSKVGKRVRCPKCSEPFVMEVPDDDDVEAVDADEFDDELPGRQRPGRSKQRSRSSGSRSKPSTLGRNSSSNSVYLIGGGIEAGFVLIVGIILFVTMQKPGTNVAVAIMPVIAPSPRRT